MNIPPLKLKLNNLDNWRWWIGPLLTMGLAIIISSLAFFASYRLPTSGAIFLLIVAYAAFNAGLSSAFLSVGLTTIYFVFELTIPLGLLTPGIDSVARVIIIGIIGPLTALMMARLKVRAEETLLEKLKLEQEHSQELQAVLTKQLQAEEEVRRLNIVLEEKVKERTSQLQTREEASTKQQQQLQAILVYSSATINLKDLDGRYLVVNPKIEELFGLDRTKILGRTSQELFPEGNFEQWSANDRQVVLTGQTQEIEEEFERPDGWRTFLSVKFPVKDETGKIFALGGISTDITERKRLEQEAHKLVSLVENSTDFIAIGSMEGKLEYLNEAALKLLGLDNLEQVNDRPMGELFPLQPPNYTGIIPSKELLAVGHLTGETVLRHFQTGEKIPVLSNKFIIKDQKTGQPLGIANVASDLREYKQAQEAIRAGQAHLSGIIEASMDAVITVNGAREIVNFNAVAEKLFGYPASEVLGGPPDRFIPEWQQAAYSEFFTNQVHPWVAPSSDLFLNPLYAIGAGGKEIPIEATLARVNVGGEIFATVFVRDITERLEAFNLLEERVNQRTTELSVLLEISQNVAADFTLQSVKELLSEQLTKLMKFNSFALYRLQKDGSFTVIGGQSAVNQSVLQEFTSKLHELSPWHIQAVTTKNPLIIDDFASNAPSQLSQHLINYQADINNIRSTMLIPLVLKDEVVGLFVLSYNEPGYYTSYHAQLAQAVGYQVAVAIENIRLYEQAQLLAALEERQRLARELHDSTSQVLYSLQLGLRALGNFLQRNQMEEASETVAYLIGLAKGGLDEMRLLIFELRPESLEREGLLRALQKQAEALEGRYSLKIKTHFSQETEPEFPIEYKDALYRISREALHNVIKHANTEQVDLQLEWDSSDIHLVIQDYGQGFELKEHFPGHYGLNSMAERVRKLPGGELKIESKPGQGTRICLKVPQPGSILLK